MKSRETESEVKEILYTPLQELGLSEQEIDVYTASLVLGPAPIQDLAKRVSIARPNVYKIIQSLELKGLAQFSEKKKYAREFLVVSPTVVLEKVRAKEKVFSETSREIALAMPDLMSFYQQGDRPAKGKVLEGREQFLKLFWMILDESKDPIRFMGSVKDFVGFISWDEERKWIKERLKRNIPIRTLVLSDTDAEVMKQQDEKELRETRFLKNILPFATSFQLFGNKVVFWQPKAPAAVVIEDEYIVAMFRNVFDHLWEESN